MLKCMHIKINTLILSLPKRRLIFDTYLKEKFKQSILKNF